MAAGSYSVLILCEERVDRKVLFDVFDGLEIGAIYSAQTVDQAAEFVSQIPINVLALELAFSRSDLDQLFEEFFDRSPDGRIVAVVPVEERQTGFSWEFLPPRVTECLASPVVPGEALFRISRMLSDPSFERGQTDDLTFDGVPVPFVLSDPKSGEIIAVNRAFELLSGDDPDEWKGTKFASVGLVLDSERRKELEFSLRQEGAVEFECVFQRRNGPQVTVRVDRRLGTHDGAMTYLTVLQDITSIRRLQTGLTLAANLFASVLRPGNAGVDEIAGWLSMDIFMVAAVERTGTVKIAALHSKGGDVSYLNDPRMHLPYEKLMNGQEVISAANARKVVGKDPFVVENNIAAYIGLPIASSSGTVIGVVIAAREEPLIDAGSTIDALRLVSAYFGSRWENRQLKTQSEVRGLHDSLTGLPNRMLFNDRLKLSLNEAQRSGESFAVMFVDLDRFKNINDSLGHAVGDQVLRGVAERLVDSVRTSDTVARYAGDEFTVILRHIVQKQDVMRVAQKINEVLSRPLKVHGQDELFVTASVGVSVYPDDGRSAEDLLKNADMAMYSAKGMGRNTFQSFQARDQEASQQRAMLESKLRHAVANEELRVYYQPQVSAITEDIVGMEALIRWEHPELGLISPGFFIPLAEETGLIVPIGEWLMREAIMDTRGWHDQFGLPLTLGVNLSPLQLMQANLLEVVEESLNQANLEPQYLDLEVTESMSIKSIDGLRERLEALRDLGCKVSIDDFGTGQASLDYLKRFPADRIKIDQSFVRNIGVDPDDAAIVKATIEMAHSLSMGVIAEGVEEEDHLTFLRELGCEELQGFLFCRPLPTEAFTQMLTEREALRAGGAVSYTE